MSIFKLFSGPSPEKLEQKGDVLFEGRQWGQAKQAYDHALHKFDKQQPGQHTIDKNRIEGKNLRTRNELAREHHQNAESYLEGGHIEDALELMSLAMEIAADEEFVQKLKRQYHDIERKTDQEISEVFSDEEKEQEETDEYFYALCGTLPEEVQDAYMSYGENFKAGYLALNRGDFEAASTSAGRKRDRYTAGYRPPTTPTASTRFVMRLTATIEGSTTAIPRPRT